MVVKIPLDYINSNDSDSKCNKDGICQIKALNNQWYSRYIRLTDTHLILYRNGGKSSLPVGISLINTTVIDCIPYSGTDHTSAHILSITNTFNSKSYVLRFATSDDCISWCDLLKLKSECNTADQLQQHQYHTLMQVDVDDNDQHDNIHSINGSTLTQDSHEHKTNDNDEDMDKLPIFSEDRTLINTKNDHNTHIIDINRVCTITTLNQTQSYDITKNVILKQGYMKQYDNKSNQWLPRYYILQGYHLLCYTNKRELRLIDDIHLIGTLCEYNTTVKHKQSMYCCRVVQTYQPKQSYIYQCQSRDELDEWIYCIKLRHTYTGYNNIPLKLNPSHNTLSIHMNPNNQHIHQIVQSISTNNTTKCTNIECYNKSTTLIKSRVSKKKRRYVYDGYDLDLVYITDRIIAMGFPATGIESIYRNNINDVKRLLYTKHNNHCRIYNLCSERSYNPGEFNHNVVEFPFDDHNCPQFVDLIYFCHDMNTWLQADLNNIVAIHCKAGKGRTGLMICVYLLYLGIWSSARDVLDYYARMRTLNDKGVTIASQIRYVEMFEKYLKQSALNIELPISCKIQLHTIEFSCTTPKWDSFQISCHGIIYHSTTLQYTMKYNKNNGYTVQLHSNHIYIQNDFCINFYKHKLLGRRQIVFGCWLHTQFIDDYTVKLNKSTIDKVCKQKNVPDFTMNLYFGCIDSSSIQNELVDSYGNEPATAALIEGRHLTQYILHLNDVKLIDIFLSLHEYTSEPVLSYVDIHELMPSQLLPINEIHELIIGWSDMTWHQICNYRYKQNILIDQQLCLTVVTSSSRLYFTCLNQRQLHSIIDGIQHILQCNNIHINEQQVAQSLFVPEVSPVSKLHANNTTPLVSTDMTTYNEMNRVSEDVSHIDISRHPVVDQSKRRTASMQDIISALRIFNANKRTSMESKRSSVGSQCSNIPA